MHNDFSSLLIGYESPIMVIIVRFEVVFLFQCPLVIVPHLLFLSLSSSVCLSLSLHFSQLHSQKHSFITTPSFYPPSLPPGEDTSLEIALKRPMVSEVGQRFTLRDGRITLGTGIITKVLTNIETEV